ncbi:LLM class flavin-dependent oxidoreductase [Curtobacterium sp. ZW137]|uniref:LLM class flavin-dependent oxidoreductase n=1 Tax=Curtobacterium sp. ZW137 TaxID=2485104 RepID=UPI000F4BD2A8|nr:LLM class flavin-dependent oxidoreductase [Curtobacterium sp. ZW137]ROP65910.1 alkanesulfonate monooxygenase SsuD/methylene tetrahydromethanopterin reductase-like flavin-dependent oxidoreductase (luciferase family) [Curtobacterium sp. ZW137]
MSIDSLAVLVPGNFDDDAPAAGLESTLDLFATAERLGVDGAWVRHRHLEHGIGSAAVFLAAASQRTTRIELGVAVVPIGWESPFRLAEDFSLADVLSHGRVQVGLSTGTPHADLLGDRVFDGDWRSFDLGYGRVSRFLENLHGTFLGDADTVIASPGNVQRPRLQPYAPGLVDRVWYGAGSLRSAAFAGSAGLNLLLGNLTSGEDTDDYGTAQRNQLAAYRAALPEGHRPRVAWGRCLVPTDSADRVSRDRYTAWRDSRLERQTAPQGPRRTLFSSDLVGTSEQIVEQLVHDATFAEVDEFRVELPYEFAADEYEQIVEDVVTKVAPELGWTPAIHRAEAVPA